MRYPTLQKVLADIQFKSGPGFKKALEILDVLSDEELADKDQAVNLLKEAGLHTQANLISEMSWVEWEDFIVNNLDEE